MFGCVTELVILISVVTRSPDRFTTSCLGT